MDPERTSLYERVGGMPYFERLVGHFYDGVAGDPVLRPLYPEDLGPAQRHLVLFLAQYWGGPSTYAAERGHPRLRMRHLPFPIALAERDAWMAHMRAAVEAAGTPSDEATELLDYFERAATHLVNRPGC